ncbi:MAG: cytochrome c3 family protein [Bacteroidota bacterium]|nr:cytochrome c3 family protein [Bacteroidota bacterium]
MNSNVAGGLLGLPNEIALGLLITLLLLLGVIAVILYRARKQVDLLRNVNQDIVHKETRLSKLLFWYNTRLNKTMFFLFLGLVIFLFSVVGWYGRAQDLGTQIGYAPEQPIKFNHKLHAGQYNIQCQYCHIGVEKGKQAGIPSLNVCMNCHNAIQQGPQYGKTEIAKIYKAMDYDAEKREYGNNPNPVKWVRIHNLPDHVYFNHAQHVKAGKLQCANCHGAVNQMERVQQTATLEMGWCINCHREKQIDSKGNKYYAATYDFVEKHKAYTVAQMGGLECAKCHY